MISVTLQAQNYWIKQQSQTAKSLYKVSFVDSLNGWAVGDSSIIVHTSNGGVNWVQQSSPYDGYIWSVCFINTSKGWAVANNINVFGGSWILYTTNGGNLWNAYRYPDSTFFLITICFTDALTGWLCGNEGLILKSTDGGFNWIQQTVDTSAFAAYPIRSIVFGDADLAFACGGYQDLSGVVWRSTNQGSFWTAQGVAPEPIYDIEFIDSLKALGVGGDPEFGVSTIKTTNMGAVWDYVPMNFWGIGQAISFRTRSEAWVAMGFSGSVAVSIDTGNTWLEVPLSDSGTAFDIIFTDPFHGWIVGNNGYIAKFNSGLIGIENQTINNLPRQNKLSQNYPNPFNPRTTIEFQLDKTSRISLTLYDLLGREVRVLFSGIKSKGLHTIVLDAANLSSGVYYYVLKTQDYSETKKLVVLK
jgi:photosystem II stability/assembly factor-like uncharacterized protein